MSIMFSAHLAVWAKENCPGVNRTILNGSQFVTFKQKWSYCRLYNRGYEYIKITLKNPIPPSLFTNHIFSPFHFPFN